MSTISKNTPSTRQRYTRAFKLEAVELAERGEQPMADIARSLGIKREVLYAWRDTVRKNGIDHAFRGPGRSKPKTDQAAEIAALRRELEQVKEERDILKKAAAYFAKELP